MDALISDLHSNIEALQAVMEDMADCGVERVYCLGDVIGYGPNPREVLAAVKDAEFILKGNHEEGLLYYAEDFNERARDALTWTRDALNDPAFDKAENYELWGMIDDLPEVMRTDRAIYVHGSLRQPTRDYVLPSDARDAAKMGAIFGAMDRGVCFFGHTHIPGVWTESGQFLAPADVGGAFILPSDEKVCINVGSVGQPRDGDNRAAYVLFDGERAVFRRVPYDYKATMLKIVANPMLSDTLAARLEVGR